MSPQPSTATETVQRDAIDLKIMATTDLHMHIPGHEHFTNRASTGFGPARAARVITAKRKLSDNALPFDSRDSLQGSPMGDFAAGPGSLVRNSTLPSPR